eukprot:1686467-Alexandrium_andersonii.AAC.1
MLEHICQVVRRAIQWIDSCSCHGPLLGLRDLEGMGVPRKLIQQWEQCPLRGMRAAEVCSGGFGQVFAQMCEATAADVLVSLPSDMSGADRVYIMTDFHAGVAHVSFYMVCKLSHMSEPPWLLYQLAHWDVAVAQQALRRLLISQ